MHTTATSGRQRELRTPTRRTWLTTAHALQQDQNRTYCGGARRVRLFYDIQCSTLNTRATSAPTPTDHCHHTTLRHRSEPTVLAGHQNGMATMTIHHEHLREAHPPPRALELSCATRASELTPQQATYRDQRNKTTQLAYDGAHYSNE